MIFHDFRLGSAGPPPRLWSLPELLAIAGGLAKSSEDSACGPGPLIALNTEHTSHSDHLVPLTRSHGTSTRSRASQKAMYKKKPGLSV